MASQLDAPSTKSTLVTTIDALCDEILRADKLVFGERPQADEKSLVSGGSRISMYIARLKDSLAILKTVNDQLELLA